MGRASSAELARRWNGGVLWVRAWVVWLHGGGCRRGEGRRGPVGEVGGGLGRGAGGMYMRGLCKGV